MSNTQTPAYLQDSAQLLSADGFATSNVWYHGTASGLFDAIKEQGLKQSGDVELLKKAKGAMIAIGGSFKESKDPVFLTQSKELAYFWANQTTKTRNTRFGQGENPVVLAVTLPDALNNSIKPDVGAAAMLMAGDHKYFDALNVIYQSNNMKAPEIDPATSDRMDYLTRLGMAYSKQDIAAEFIELVNS